MSSDTRRARPSARLQLIAARCMLAVAGTAVIAACGSVTAPASGSASSPAAAKVSLHITLMNGAGSKPKYWTLSCDPTGGTQPHAAAACSALLAFKDPFGRPAAHHMCPMILASDKRATFTGTYFGAKVNRTIVDGGCDLARWAKLGQIMN